MKKAVILLLALVMLASLAACGGSGGNAGGTAPPAGSTTPANTTPVIPGVTAPAVDTGNQTTLADDEPRHGGKLTMVIPGNTFDVPFGVVWHYMTSFRPSHTFIEALMMETPRGEMFPYLATSMTPDAEKKEIVYKLRDDVYFPDGTQFNAEVVAWHVKEWQDSGFLEPTVTGTDIRGEFEIAILMSEYGNWAPNFLSSRVAGFISMENFLKNGSDYAEQHPMGTGPFVQKEWIPGISITWEKRNDYWQPDKPYLDEFKFVAMTDSMTQNAAMVSSGADGIDILQTGNPEQIKTLLDLVDCYAVGTPTGPMCLLPSSNNEGSPLAIKEVREALYYAIDREAICEARGFGVWTPSTQVIPDTFYGHLPDRQEASYDPARAKELLAKAGFPNGLEMNFYAGASSDRDTMVALQDMMGQVGIKANLEFPETGLMIELRTKGFEGIMAGGVRPLSNITSTIFMYFDPNYIYYPMMWRPAELTDLYWTLRTTPLVRQDLMEEYCQVLMDETIVIPVYDAYSMFVVKNDVHGGGFGTFGAGTEFLPADIWMTR